MGDDNKKRNPYENPCYQMCLDPQSRSRKMSYNPDAFLACFEEEDDYYGSEDSAYFNTCVRPYCADPSSSSKNHTPKAPKTDSGSQSMHKLKGEPELTVRQGTSDTEKTQKLENDGLGQNDDLSRQLADDAIETIHTNSMDLEKSGTNINVHDREADAKKTGNENTQMSPIEMLKGRKLQAYNETAFHEALKLFFNSKIPQEENKFLIQQFSRWAEEKHNPALAFAVLEGTSYSGMARTFNVKGVKAPVSTSKNYATVIHKNTSKERGRLLGVHEMKDGAYESYEYLKENGIVCNEGAKIGVDIAYRDNKEIRSGFAASNMSIKKENLNKNFILSGGEQEAGMEQVSSIPILTEDIRNVKQGDALYYWDRTDTLNAVIDACGDAFSPEVTKYLIGDELSDETKTKVLSKINSSEKKIAPSKTPAHIELVLAVKKEGQETKIVLVGAHGSAKPNGIARDSSGKVEWQKLSSIMSNQKRLVRLYQINDPHRTIVDFGDIFFETPQKYDYNLKTKVSGQ